MASHFGIPYLAGGGITGVTTFFVLSGFLITSLLLAEKRATGRIGFQAFYIRRAARLLPALALVLLIVGSGLIVVERRPDIAILGVTSSALYVSNLVVAANANIGPLEHTWSLAIEEQFYFFWPALLAVGLKRPRLLGVLVVALIALAAIARVGPLDDHDHLWFAYHHTITRIDAILIGCLLAFVSWRPSTPLVVVAAVLLAIIVAIPPTPGALIVVLLLPVSLCAGVLVLARPAALAWRPLMAVGKISYGLYLWHFPVVAVLPPLLAAPVTFLVAWVSYRWLEQPIRIAARRWESRSRAHRPPAAAGTQMATERALPATD